MKLIDFLKLNGVDICDCNNQGANIIKAGLSERRRVDLNFEKNLDELTDDEVHDVFYSWILEGRHGLGVLSYYDIVNRMRNDFSLAKGNHS